MSLIVTPTKLGGPVLTRDYLAGSPVARRFFPAGDPYHIDTYRLQLERVRSRFSRADRESIADALVPTSDSARQRLARWVEQGGAVVTTGQQAGLFTGPLFTLYKALTAVRLARSLESALNTIILPVFWVASEDHDWDEVNHTFAVDPADRLVRLEAPHREPPRPPIPAVDRTLAPGIETTVGVLAQIVGNQPFDDRYLEYVRGAYVEGRTVAAAFGEVLRQVLAPVDAYVADAADEAVKVRSVEVLGRSLEESEAEEALLRATTEALRREGYDSQVSVLPRSPNVFIRTSHGRERLIRDRTGWIGRESGVRLRSGEPFEALAGEPVRVSPNVLLRPVVESAVFPVLAYVAGPGEVAYWGQLGALFSHHRLQMPAVYARAGFRLIESSVNQRMSELEISAEEVSRPLHELVEARARESLPKEVREALVSLRQGIVEGFDGLVPSFHRMDPTLVGAIGAARNRALLEARRMERKVIRTQKRTEAKWAERVEGVQSHLWPIGAPQERILNGIPYLARYGESLLISLLAQIPEPFPNGSE